jgi:plastocyanin
MIRRWTSALALGAAASLVGVPAAPAAEPVRIVSVGFAYLLPETELARGTAVELVNLDPAPHNITALVTGRNGSPLFTSSTVGAAETTKVKGIERLGPGVYDYTCTLHPQMLGSFYITG